MYFSLLVYLISVWQFLENQNLVYNGNFEKYSICPSWNNTFNVDNWTSPDRSTPDYFNLNCQEDSNNFVLISQMANDSFRPYLGNGFAGIIPIVPSGYMEHIQGDLKIPLISGKKYQVSFYVYFLDLVSSYSTYKMGIYFSRNRFLENKLEPGYYQFAMNPKYVACVENKKDNFLDSSCWVKISGEFEAKGGERYITIGTFYENDKKVDEQCSKFLKKYARKDNNRGRIPALESSFLRKNYPKKSIRFFEKSPYYLIDNVTVYEVN